MSYIERGFFGAAPADDVLIVRMVSASAGEFTCEPTPAREFYWGEDSDFTTVAYETLHPYEPPEGEYDGPGIGEWLDAKYPDRPEPLNRH